MFALDANVFIEARRRYYGLDLCPGFWECLRHYSVRQRLLSIDRVRDELLRGGDALSKWVKENPARVDQIASAERGAGDYSPNSQSNRSGNGTIGTLQETQMIQFKTDDILAEGAEALVSTMNCVGVMARGVAPEDLF